MKAPLRLVSTGLMAKLKDDNLTKERAYNGGYAEDAAYDAYSYGQPNILTLKGECRSTLTSEQCSFG